MVVKRRRRADGKDDAEACTDQSVEVWADLFRNIEWPRFWAVVDRMRSPEHLQLLALAGCMKAFSECILGTRHLQKPHYTCINKDLTRLNLTMPPDIFGKGNCMWGPKLFELYEYADEDLQDARNLQRAIEGGDVTKTVALQALTMELKFLAQREAAGELIAQLTWVLQMCPNLTHLDLSGRDLHHKFNASAKRALLDVMSPSLGYSCPHLRFLNLSGHNIEIGDISVVRDWVRKEWWLILKKLLGDNPKLTICDNTPKGNFQWYSQDSVIFFNYHPTRDAWEHACK